MQPQGWRAQLSMRLAPRSGRTVIDGLRHEGPLRVQRAFHPEGAPAHVYLLHPPGGLVGGDRLEVDIEVAPGGHALVTTPAAGKLYRSDGKPAEQRQTLRVGAGATLEWLPQENIVYSGAWARLGTRVELGEGASFLGWETVALGRPAANEAFARGECRQRFELWRDGRPLWLERGLYRGDDALLADDVGLGGFACVGTFVAVGRPIPGLDAIRAAMGPGRHGLTCLDDVLVARALAGSAEEVRRVLLAVWSRVREPLTGAPPVPPRIWST